MDSDFVFFLTLCFKCLKYTIKICLINLEISKFFHGFLSLFCSVYDYLLSWILLNKIFELRSFKKSTPRLKTLVTLLTCKLCHHLLTMVETRKGNIISDWISGGKTRILFQISFHIERGMYSEIFSPNCHFDGRGTSPSCVQSPTWYRVKSYRNKSINKKEVWLEKTQTHGYSQGILEMRVLVWALKNCAKMFDQFFLNNDIIVLLCIKRTYVHLMHISSSLNGWKHF